MDTDGLLLFAHGARDPRWAHPFEQVAEQVRNACPALRVELAYLEFMTPNLAEGGAGLAAAGCANVAIVPLFLGAGGHVRKDLPEQVEQLRRTHPATAWHLKPAAGESSVIVDALARVALGACGRVAESPEASSDGVPLQAGP